MSEYWKQIEQQRLLRETQEREVQRKREESQRELEKKREEEKESEIVIINKQLNIVESFFEDIRLNAPEIRKEPRSIIIRDGAKKVDLLWGVKLDFTDNERAIVNNWNTNDIRVLGDPCPSKECFLAFDGYDLSAFPTGNKKMGIEEGIRIQLKVPMNERLTDERYTDTHYGYSVVMTGVEDVLENKIFIAKFERFFHKITSENRYNRYTAYIRHITEEDRRAAERQSFYYPPPQEYQGGS